ncbi:carbohydrate-binding protein [Demequina gelatinilytica]|uniref:carbohydrate-binding protein n=1 Tax=Demequina gelatinilytica TaxID=1638980 RepID=UPI000AC7027D|nr:carbohydrate-binding protein [Demequina gelatinilytica]
MRFTAAATFAATAGALLTAASVPAAQAVDSPGSAYTWSNVAISGGGYVPGIIYNQTEEGLVYARTDIGGAYRLDRTTDTWIPLLDHVGWDQWNRLGVLSLATDPVDTARVYAAVGMYTNEWDESNGAILRSADYGETWEATALPFKVGGNMPGRGIGERLQVDPNDNDVLYYGAESGQGLWRSTDAGVTFSQVDAFPNVGDFVPDASSGNSYLMQNLGVLWTAFDAASSAPGEATRTVFTAVADTDSILYRSDDAGETWAPVEGAPTGFLPHHGVIDEAGRYLYLTTSSTSGPYDGSDGEVWRYGLDDGTWTDITPPQRPVGVDFGFGGLTVDRTDPDTLMVASQIQWWPDVLIFRSTDRGETWSPIWDYDWSTGGTLVTRYDQSIDEVPWLRFGKQVGEPTMWAEPTPKLGWMISALEIDPFNPDELMYGTGATIYRSENLTDWDEAGGVIDIEPGADGIEETAIQDLVAPAGDVDLVSAMLDLGGFVHDDITAVTDTFQDPYFGGATSVDAAGLEEGTIARAGTDGSGAHVVAVSHDAGETWTASPAADGASGPGTVAVAADGQGLVWAPAGADARYSADGGATWAASAGLPTGVRVEADRVDASLLYGFADGTFYASTDAGATFVAASSVLPAEGNVRFAAMPGAPGEVWLAGGDEDGAYGLWRSHDAGATWKRVAGFDEADTVGFGKAAPGATWPAIYTAASRDGERGVWRSLDGGGTWERINDDEHQWGWIGADIEGDPDVFGRVYIATNGRGIVVGDDAAAAAPGEWIARTAYREGDVVSHDGAVWVATWWTRAQEPGAVYGPWQEVAAAPSGVAVWTATRIFTRGDVVVDADGVLWRAKWWTRGQAPGASPWGPWEPLS